jgi:hypothetical protein
LPAPSRPVIGYRMTRAPTPGRLAPHPASPRGAAHDKDDFTDRVSSILGVTPVAISPLWM